MRSAVLLAAAFTGATGLVVLAGFDDQPQAIERASSSAQAGNQLLVVEATRAQHWLENEVTVVIDASVNSIEPNADQAIIQAFGAWLSSTPNLPELRIESGRGLEPRLEPDGVNAVMYAPIRFPGHQDDLAITIGFSDQETGEITEADIIINSHHTYAILKPEAGPPTSSCNGSTNAKSCGFRYDLQNVMTHEVGHFYGLGEDRLDRSATMYSCTSACETHKREPSGADRQAMGALYVTRQQHQASLAGCQGARIAPPGRLSGFGLVGALGLLGLLRWRRSLAPEPSALHVASGSTY